MTEVYTESYRNGYVPAEAFSYMRKKYKKKKRAFIYILMLECGKWYVGLTINPIRRIAEHFGKPLSYPPAQWTLRYKPVSVHRIIRVDHLSKNPEYYEKLYTLAFMKKYGMNNVRGGKWCYTNHPIPKDKVRDIKSTLTKQSEALEALLT